MLQYIILPLLVSVTPLDERDAWKDKQSFPVESQQYIAYMSLSDVDDESEKQLEDVAKVCVCSLSSASHLPSHNPQRVAGTKLLRLNLQALKWEATYPKVLVAYYPYRPDLTQNAPTPLYPMVISALWFVSNVTDAVRTKNAQDKLLYGEKPPVNVKELQAFWKVNTAPENTYGYIEGESGVAEQRVRIVEELPTSIRTYAYQTKDSELITDKNDPLANLIPNSFKFDASEIIIGIPKTSQRKLGALQAYWLADGKGNRQEKAPASIVADKLATRTHEIRNWVSCIQCHSQGIIPTSLDEYARFFKAGAGAEAYDYATQEQITAYLEIDMGGRIKQAQQQYADGIDLVCGLKPEEFSTAYVKMIKRYDADLTLDDCAREVGCKPEQLKLALAYQSAKKVNVDPRLVQLGHDVPILRVRWEFLQPLAGHYVQEYLNSEKGK